MVTFGNVYMKTHNKSQQVVDALQKRIKNPQKLRNTKLLSNGFTIAAPRFGGRTVYLWVKNKTRVWIDKNVCYMTNSTFPKSFTDGTLIQGELYKHNDIWIVAFEDLIMYEGHFIEKPFITRLQMLITATEDLIRFADPSRDPGVYNVKPWFPTVSLLDSLSPEKFHKQPSFLIIKFLPKNAKASGSDYGITQETFTLKISNEPGNVDMGTDVEKSDKLHSVKNNNKYLRHIYKIEDGEPDQYELKDPKDASKTGRACVRTLQNSLWLSSLENGSKVWCRKVSGHTNLEPYSDA